MKIFLPFHREYFIFFVNFASAIELTKKKIWREDLKRRFSKTENFSQKFF